MANILDAFRENQVTESVDTSRKLKVGIIGTGWIAEAHVALYKAMPDVEIVAGADLIEGKAEAFFKKMELDNVRCYLSHSDMLRNEQLDAVSVCTYNSTHAECTIDSLRAGVNVLLEKPMCVTLEEAVEIRKAEKETGKIVSVGFQPRLDPNMKMLKQIIQSGELGDIYYVQTGGGRRRGIPAPFGTSFIEKDKGAIGAIGDIGCYSLDMVLNSLGYPKPVKISGYTSDFFGKSREYWKGVGKPEEYADIFAVDDFAAAFIRFETGMIIDFRISWAMNLDTSGDTIFYGTKGSLRVPSTECWNGSIGGPLKLYKTVAGEDVCTEFPIKKLPQDSKYCGNYCFYQKIRTFLDAIKENGTSPVPTSEIIINQAIIDGIVNSSKQGHEIDVTIPEI